MAEGISRQFVRVHVVFAKSNGRECDNRVGVKAEMSDGRIRGSSAL